ncbi:hypothetical protein A6R68_04512 [Neotoma lepida]|uniref:Uncharacterized protein n=1 Tax=Neotoma lepida TaxID=56216 RepID=A0A1A6GKW8_NEOLE|nr:hypothetical protein A6R68_04512 [Neotoma lepida]
MAVPDTNSSLWYQSWPPGLQTDSPTLLPAVSINRKFRAMMSGFSLPPQKSQDDQHHLPKQPPLPALLAQHSIPGKGKV